MLSAAADAKSHSAGAFSFPVFSLSLGCFLSKYCARARFNEIFVCQDSEEAVVGRTDRALGHVCVVCGSTRHAEDNHARYKHSEFYSFADSFIH